MSDITVPTKEGAITVPIEDMPDGVFTLTPKIEGFIETDYTIVKYNNCIQNSPQRLFVNPLLTTPGECRVTLAWGSAPRDLDIHVKTSDGQEVSYTTRETKNSSVKLDIDVTKGYGPETMTFLPDKGIKYRVFVHNYSNDTELYKSEAILFFLSYNNSNNIELRISQDSHSKDYTYWDCFELDDRGIPVIINKVTMRDPKPGIY